MIRFEHVTKQFEGREVLPDLSFEIQTGELVALVGASGTGKSVLLKHLVRLLTPTRGEVWLDEVEISSASGKNLARVRTRFGYLFQGGALLGWLTVGENVALPLREGTSLSESEIVTRVTEALRAVGLEESIDRYPAEISGGMQKRAALARVLVRQSDVILYDEPTSGLDPVTSQTINALIVRLNKTRHITSLVVTHDLQSALLYADRILMLAHGKVAALATPEEFVHSSQEDVRQFLAAQLITEESFNHMRKNHETK